jgi:CBS domain-containing protein
VICPVCHFGNFPGDDSCANCGADLTNTDTPQSTTSFRGRLLGMHLDELGAPEPHVIDAAVGVEEAIARMQAEGIDCLLVTDAGALVGIFTDRDAILKVAGRPSADQTVGEVMTHDPVILRTGDPVAVAIHKMAVGGFRHIPILHGGEVAAIVTSRDIFRYVTRIMTERGSPMPDAYQDELISGGVPDGMARDPGGAEPTPQPVSASSEGA